jgi:4,5-DOPA dioxygenase extradiol
MDMSKRMPVIFLGHGNPMNAIQHNAYTEAWAAIGSSITRPRAIVSISAHWYVPGTAVTAMAVPRTIHDFGGFPPELHAIQYRASGDPELATRIQNLLAPLPVARDAEWGLDHGTWSVLCHVFPHADIPVLQLSIDETKSPADHYEIGRRLSALRDEGVLLLGSGDIVHNLRTYAWNKQHAEAYGWAVRFETTVRELLIRGEHEPLVSYQSLGEDALMSVPTPEHYLPLLYILGASEKGEIPTFPVEGMEGGSVSMLAVQFG